MTRHKSLKKRCYRKKRHSHDINMHLQLTAPYQRHRHLQPHHRHRRLRPLCTRFQRSIRIKKLPIPFEVHNQKPKHFQHSCDVISTIHDLFVLPLLFLLMCIRLLCSFISLQLNLVQSFCVNNVIVFKCRKCRNYIECSQSLCVYYSGYCNVFFSSFLLKKKRPFIHFIWYARDNLTCQNCTIYFVCPPNSAFAIDNYHSTIFQAFRARFQINI